MRFALIGFRLALHARFRPFDTECIVVRRLASVTHRTIAAITIDIDIKRVRARIALTQPHSETELQLGRPKCVGYAQRRSAAGAHNDTSLAILASAPLE